jgi:exonuclease III
MWNGFVLELLGVCKVLHLNYDILFFQETKTDNLYYLALPDGFTYVAKHGNKCLKKSGGIVTIFKKVFQIYLNLNNDGLLILFSTECF